MDISASGISFGVHVTEIAMGRGPEWIAQREFKHFSGDCETIHRDQIERIRNPEMKKSASRRWPELRVGVRCIAK